MIPLGRTANTSVAIVLNAKEAELNPYGLLVIKQKGLLTSIAATKAGGYLARIIAFKVNVIMSAPSTGVRGANFKPFLIRAYPSLTSATNIGGRKGKA